MASINDKLSFLGVGSNGVISNDMLDAYKEIFEETTVKPIQKKMQENLDKQKSLTELTTLVEKLKGSVKKFADLDTYMKRTTTVTGEGVTATIGTGVALQDIKIGVQQLAKNDVTQFGKKFESRDSVFSRANTTLKFNHNGQDYNINIRAGQTVADVAQSITDATDGAVMGIIMKTGGSQPYQLMLQSKDSGENNRVYFGNTISSDVVSGGELKGNFNIAFKDSQGRDKTLTIAVDTPNTNTTQDNAEAVKKAIEKAITEDADLKKLYDDGTLNLGLTNNGRSFVLNDQRGHDITIAAKDEENKKLVGSLGLKEGVASSAEDAFTSGTVQGGKFEGKVTIGDVEINLADVTKEGHSAEQNLQALIDKINSESKEGFKAEAKNGRLVVNNEKGGAVQVILDAGNSRDQNARIASGLGITAGNHVSPQDFLRDTGITKIQSAQDSKFSWNGIEISRPSNTIDDVVTGISVELTKEHTGTDHSVVRITNDDKEIFDGIDEFVEAYNELITKVQELTRYDVDTKIGGVFNTESSIRGIQSTLKGILNFSVGSKNLSMSSFGFTLSDDGKLILDKKKLEDEYKKDREAALAFFRGGEITVGGTEIEVAPGVFERVGGTKTEVKGFFVQFQEAVDSLITGERSVLKAYEQSLKDEYKKDEKEKERQQEVADQRLKTQRDKMVAMDLAISKMNEQLNKLQQLISASSGN